MALPGADTAHARWVSYVALVPTFADPDDYIGENLDHWADQLARLCFPGMTVIGDWERSPQAVR